MFQGKIIPLAKRVLEAAGLKVMRAENYNLLLNQRFLSHKLDIIKETRRPDGLENLANSQSQIGQDLFVLDALGWKRGGHFVEFGAADGATLSNTHLLEKHFGWTGILAEPSPAWRTKLQASGRSAVLDFDCVWTTTGETMAFTDASVPELSTMSQFVKSDRHNRRRIGSASVKTVSLVDLLDRHNAPDVVDYLSIDTEGSEFDILNAFDFDRYRFRCITCEHNFTPQREKIYDLLTGHGYRRVSEAHSMFDDWYILPAAI